MWGGGELGKNLMLDLTLGKTLCHLKVWAWVASL